MTRLAVPCRLWPQPLVALATSLLALLALAAAWRPALEGLTTPLPALGPLARAGLPPLLLAAGLGGAVALSYRYPVHVTYKTKLILASVPLYLLAALAPPPLAATAAGLSVLASEGALRRERGLPPSALATGAARWALLVLLAARVAQWPGPPGLPPGSPLGEAAYLGRLAAAALLLGLGDVLTVALVIAPLSGDRPLQVVAAARASLAAEGVQYLLAFVAAVAAQPHPWILPVLIAPALPLYRLFKGQLEMQDETRSLLASLADTVDLRDPYTGGHSRRVTAYCAAILRELGLTGPDVTLILAAARVHDIGKIAIPDAVLNKPDKLDPEERAIMETHAAQGAAFLERYGNFGRGVKIVLHHHEAWDGSGYPAGLAGTAIPFGARVMAVADSFDAMTSDRPYRRGMPVATAARILGEGRDQQWEASVVDALLRCVAAGVVPEPGTPRGERAAPTTAPPPPTSTASPSLPHAAPDTRPACPPGAARRRSA